MQNGFFSVEVLSVLIEDEKLQTRRSTVKQKGNGFMNRCRWCSRIGATQKGRGVNSKWLFHPHCHRAVEALHGWDLEVAVAN